jgi:hypothetical protein
MLTVLDDDERPMHTICKDAVNSPRKIDGAMGCILAWEARGDCMAMGAVSLDSVQAARQDPPPKGYAPGYAPPAEHLVSASGAGPMSI